MKAARDRRSQDGSCQDRGCKDPRGLIETARELQVRLQPKAIASDVWEKAKDKGADLAEERSTRSPSGLSPSAA
jgi:hypothetical protein